MKEINYLQILQTLACQSLATLNRPQLTGNTEKNKNKKKTKKKKGRRRRRKRKKKKETRNRLGTK